MNDDIRFSAGLLDLADASRFLGIPRQTFRRWAVGDGLSAPLLHTVNPDNSTQARASLITLSEAWVLAALRDAGVRTHRIRPALERLSKDFGREYVLVSRELATDGVDVLWDFARTREGEGLIAGGTGQYVMRAIVADYMTYVGWANDGLPETLRLRSCEPSKVLIDPYRAFGQPIFAGSQVRVADAAGMIEAGDKPEVVAEELGVSIDDVRTATRVLLGRAT
ncbi:MAG: DUF433 domain-containing protein [Candidatus Nanopelagicales bacterium]|nr:DUF433 domain-containing protein [Candidatus Nanopelagicales bacterium]MDZ4249831.1 DUF433 domain-containing protein [Candidatus Nanopelagicales bacterium]